MRKCLTLPANLAASCAVNDGFQANQAPTNIQAPMNNRAPMNGMGCYRCGGNHFVRECPQPLQVGRPPNQSFTKLDGQRAIQNNKLPPPQSQAPYKPGTGNFRKGVTCFKCGREGHYASTCRMQLYCNHCQKPGHDARLCNKRLNQQRDEHNDKLNHGVFSNDDPTISFENKRGAVMAVRGIRESFPKLIFFKSIIIRV